MTTEINIDNYLSEEEKKEIAIEVFRDRISSELFKTSKGTVQSDSEVQRIIGNISHEIVMAEVQKFIPEAQQNIKDKVSEILQKGDFTYQVFKKKDAWGAQESLAVKYMNQAVEQCKDMFQARIKDVIENYDLTNDIREEVSNKFAEIAQSMEQLSELFYSKPNIKI